MNAPSRTLPNAVPLDGALPTREPFDGLTWSNLTTRAGEETTRLTVRIEVTPARWRAERWWAGATVALAVAVACARLVDSRRSVMVDHIEHPAKRLAGRPRV